MKRYIIILIMAILIFLSFISINIISEKARHKSIMTSNIISESKINNEPYKNPIVPKGFSKIETEDASWELDENGHTKWWNNGLVIQDEKGNQFVWVPCSIEENNEVPLYSRYFAQSIDEVGIPRGDERIRWYTESLTGFISYFEDSNPINNEVKKNVEQYGGFYIGRYETGIENGVLKSTVNSKEKDNWTGWENGTAVIKPNTKVWNWITTEKAIEVSQEIVNNDNAKTYLMTSYCYDTVSKWIDMSESNPFISKGDKYLEFAQDNYRKISDTGSNGEWNLNNINNFYDNVFEWTTERVISYGGNGFVNRIIDNNHAKTIRIHAGGLESFLSYAVNSRGYAPMNSAYHIIGFRAILIMK